MAIPTGVAVPQVGHFTEPGWRLSPQVEHRIRCRWKTLWFD